MRHCRGWEKRFRCDGHKFTLPRKAILEVLCSTNEHLSSEEIYMAAHKKNPSIGLTTVYRTLDLLLQMGIVYKFDFGDGRARYELIEGREEKKHHHHLICTKCGKILDYTDYINEEVEFLKIAEKGLSKKYNFMITNHLLHFFGLCEHCK